MQPFTILSGGGTSDVFSFYVHPKNTSTDPGDLAVFMCATEGPLVPEIIWLRNGKANSEGRTITSKGIHSATSELRIYPVERKHSGTYSCQATSRSVKVFSREATLFIKGELCVTLFCIPNINNCMTLNTAH